MRRAGSASCPNGTRTHGTRRALRSVVCAAVRARHRIVGWPQSRSRLFARSTPTERRRYRGSTCRSPTASSWSSSDRPGAARRPRSGWLPASRRSRAACCGSATAWSTTCRRATATSRWSSRATPCTPTSPSTRTSPSGSASRRFPRTRSTDVSTTLRMSSTSSPSSSASRARSRGVSGSGSRWVAPSSGSRRRFSWTSRSRTSTRSSACRCVRRSPDCSTTSG